MSKKLGTESNPDQSAVYQIRVAGHLRSQWAAWFDGLTVELEPNGDTLLTGRVVDQAALHGLLKKVRDLGMPLISVLRFDTGRDDSNSLDKTNMSKEQK